MTTLRQAAEQEPVDSTEKASAFMEARLWEFIRMAAVWPEAKPDPRIWTYLMVYAPLTQHEWVGLTDEEIDKTEWGPSYENPMTLAEGLQLFARAIEAKLKEKND